MNEIKIQCDTKLSLPLENLNTFQGNLKAVGESSYQKLKNEILELGFSAPFFVWKDAAKYYILDGHGRAYTVKRMKEEGYKVPDLPCVEIFAKTKTEAKKKLLGYISQYGKISPTGFHEYIMEAELSLDDLGDLDLPDFNMEEFKAEFFEDIEKDTSPLDQEPKESEEFKQCPNCGHLLT